MENEQTFAQSTSGFIEGLFSFGDIASVSDLKRREEAAEALSKMELEKGI